MSVSWTRIGMVAAVLATGTFSGAYAQRGGGGGHGGGGGGGHGGGGFGGGGGHVGGGGGFGGGGHVGGGGFSGGGARAGGGVNLGGAGGVRVGTPNIGGNLGGNIGGAVRQGSNLNLNTGAGRVGVGANTNTGVRVNNLNSAIQQAGRANVNLGTNPLNNRLGVGANVGLNNNNINRPGFNNGFNNGRYTAGYRPTNSFFFGVGSPFGSYYGSPFYRNAYGYRGPIYGYGYNRGLLGVGLGYGYPYGYGLGYGLGGYGGYGGGYGYGYGSSFGYQNVASYQPVYVVADASQPVNQPQTPGADALAQNPGAAGDYALRGEENFKAGKYDEAIKDWQHALVDVPRNGAYIMLMSQAFFATGRYNEAAGAVQAGTQLLPEKDWGVVVQNYKELYSNQGDYTNQLRALEKARTDKQDEPSLRFLLGWHYHYLGYPTQSLKEIDRAVELAPKDEITAKVRDVFAKAPAASPASQAAAR